MVQLRSAKTYLEAILATVPDAMIAFDRAGTIDSFSATAERMFQLTAEEARGRRFHRCFRRTPKRNSMISSPSTRRAETASRADDAGVLAQRKDGSTVPIELHVSDVLLDSNLQFIAFIRDLTERQCAKAGGNAPKRAAATSRADQYGRDGVSARP
jgi:two-component system sensor kinase FixL